MAQTAWWLWNSPHVLEACHRRHGDVFALKLAPRLVSGPGAGPADGRWIFLADPDDVRQVHTADPAVVRTGETNEFLKCLVGPASILLLDEPEHMTQRRLLLPPLHGERVQRYAALMAEIARVEISRWPVGRPFALWPRMQAITLEVIIRTVLGTPGTVPVGELRRHLATLLNRMTSTVWLGAQTVLIMLAGQERVANGRLVRRLIDPIDQMLLGEIGHRRTASDLDERDDILSMLLRARFEDGEALSDSQLRDELVTLLIAGHESTATMLAWAFELLLRHPQALSRLKDEVASGDEAYADAIVKETLRLRPVIPFTLRKIAEPMEIGGHALPAGAWIAPCAYLLHRRAEIYPEPWRFRPERFLERPPGTYTWMPFGGGVRRCLGASFAQLEMRQVLASVVANTDLRPARAAPEAIKRRFITLAPARGAEVVMYGRLAPP